MTRQAFDFEAFERLRQDWGFALKSTRGPEAFATLDGSPEALLEELVRLARIGAHAEHAAGERPNKAVSIIVAELRQAGAL